MSCCAALAALQHIAESASADDLRGSRELLADTAKRVVTGADERVWPAAAPAACTLVTAVEGVREAPVHMLSVVSHLYCIHCKHSMG